MFSQAALLSGEGLSEKVSLYVKTREFVSTMQETTKFQRLQCYRLANISEEYLLTWYYRVSI